MSTDKGTQGKDTSRHQHVCKDKVYWLITTIRPFVLYNLSPTKM